MKKLKCFYLFFSLFLYSMSEIICFIKQHFRKVKSLRIILNQTLAAWNLKGLYS